MRRQLATALWLLWATSVAAQVRLVPVATSGVSSPTFLTHAGDGSNRLFILEQRGVIDVLQPGDSSVSVFLDIRSKVLSGGERGLLGLAFHPLYARNGRFFVYYTRAGDGALVVAEYVVSSNPNLAAPNETVLLTMAHPTNSNHNGGMLVFGPGGYLHIGVGDGGSANDPPNNAQNLETLLGKELRIDVDTPDAAAGTRYSSPASNPFVGKPGRDEIFAYGLRNPWRFSFDRSTNAQWLADVGQNAREEVDTPVLPGANFGWRVYEGTACTNTDPSLCRPGSYVAPLFDYSHSGGRCSITGGYVYRGSRGTFPGGTYVYGDYCSGEIFTWDGRTQSRLFDTALGITSFGEDEAGEIYVLGAGGSILRLVGASCVASITPGVVTAGPAGGIGTLTVSADPDCAWDALPLEAWIAVLTGRSGRGSGTITYAVAPLTGDVRSRSGTLAISGLPLRVTQFR